MDSHQLNAAHSARDEDAQPTAESALEVQRNTLWVDVEDLFEYAAWNARPSGIQRLSFELYKALVAEQSNHVPVRFLRRTIDNSAFYSISWHYVEELFADLAAGPASNSPHSTNVEDDRSGREAIYRFVKRVIPRPLRTPLAGFFHHQTESFRCLGNVLRQPATKAKLDNRAKTPPAHDIFQRAAKNGDVLASFGAPWSEPDFSDLVRREKETRGIQFAMLVYDIIPLRRPEFTDRDLTKAFDRWLRATLPLSDKIFVISQATGKDLAEFADEQAMPLKSQPVVIPLGAELGANTADPERNWDRSLPEGSYALIVSTIEARKNHELLFRIWRKLLLDLPHENIPTLVFAGKIGWLVSDLLNKLKNTNFLNGKIIILDSPTDCELSRLYDGCSFTLFPSFYEGWGLPITESLAFGRPCIASNRTSLPEAGGDLVRYFDPDDFYQAYKVVRQTIENPDDLTNWRERIIEEFAPVTWVDTARVVLAEIQRV